MRNKPPTLVFDMDGTLVNVSGIRHLISTPRQKNFDAFHRESVNCPPHQWVVNAAQTAKLQGYTIIQVTARSQKYYGPTAWWIAENKVPSDGLFMRADRDFRKDSIVKREIIDRLLRRFDIIGAYDDNPSIIELWDEYEIPCITVPGWET